ncbi:MAG: hypothetical protein L6R40_008088 [Gallowayella cf. fulva]|nr:MAG: hypothetical protein L6R40_008088 [Xanthomendoza cf. fulva]
MSRNQRAPIEPAQSVRLEWGQALGRPDVPLVNTIKATSPSTSTDLSSMLASVDVVSTGSFSLSKLGRGSQPVVKESLIDVEILKGECEKSELRIALLNLDPVSQHPRIQRNERDVKSGSSPERNRELGATVEEYDNRLPRAKTIVV